MALNPGILRFDGVKWVIDSEINVQGPAGPAGTQGSPGATGPAGPSGANSTQLFRIYTVGTSGSITADYVCDGINDEVQINQAITSAIASNPIRSVVRLLPGTYSIGAPIELKSNVVLEGSGVGATKIVVSSSFVESNIYAIGALGSEIGSAINLTANATYGQQILSCTAGTDLSAVAYEDYLFLLSEALWEVSTNPPAPFTPASGRKVGEYVRVLAKDSSGANTLDIFGMARDNYLVSDTARLYRMNFIENCGIRNLEIYQQGAENSRTGNIAPMISLQKVRNGFIEDVYIHHNDGPGITIFQSVSININNCVVKDLSNNTSINHYGYGILIGGASESVTVSNCRFNRVRHGVDSGPSRSISSPTGSYGIPRGITVSNNVVTHATNAAYSTHNEAENWSFVGNVASNCLSFGMYMRGRGSSLIGNIIEWCGGGIGIGDPTFNSSGGSASNSRVLSNTIRHIKKQPSILPSYVALGTTSSTYAVGEGIIIALTDNSVFANNVISDCDSAGIRLRLSAIKNIIRNNTILNCNLLNAASTSAEAITIDGNYNGSTASLTFSSPTITLTRTGANFQAALAGRTITVSGSATPGNNGSFTIVSVTSTTSLTYTNASGATDANNGAISYWIEGSTDNIIEGNFAANTNTLYDRNTTGHMKYLIRDYGVAGNVRNVYRNNFGLGMETNLLSINSNSYSAGNASSELSPIKTLTSAPVDSTFLATPQAGGIVYDSTNKKMYVRTTTTNTWDRFDFKTINQWEPTVVSPQINQEDQTAASTNGRSLLVRAQNALGVTSSGGNLNLAPGSGTTANGTVRLTDPSATNTIQFTLNPTGSTTMTFVAGITAPSIVQSSTSTTSGATLQLSAQATSFDTGTGGAMSLSAGAATGATTGTGGSVFLSSGTGTTANGSVSLRVGGTTFITFGPNPNPTGSVDMNWVSSITSPRIIHASTSTTSGATFIVAAQSSSFAGSTGGSLTLSAGSGVTTGGDVTISLGSGGTNGSLRLTNTTSTTSATGGSATALPAQPQGYLTVFINGVARKIPYYN